MDRIELKRFFERKKVQKQQKDQFERSNDYLSLQETVVLVQTGHSLDIPQTLVTLEQFYLESAAFEKDYKALYAKRCLHLGAALNAVRNYVDQVAPRTWVKWRNQHITFISARKCENLMKLAQEDGVEEFTYMGIAALVLLNTAIDSLYSKGKFTKRFQAFFSESTYPYREYHKSSTVKKLITIHTFEVKATRERLKFDLSLVKSLAEYKDVLNDKLVENLLQHQETGSANKRLKVLIIGKGKPPKITTNSQNKSKQLSIDRDAAKLIGTVDNYLNRFDRLGEVQFEVLEKLIGKLDDLYWDKLTFDLVK